MLEVRNLDAGYGRVRVLRGVSLTVPAGKIVALLGANGAGKTTLMRAICGLASIQAGTVTLAGKATTGRAPEALVRDGLVLVPQGRLLFGDMTVRENLEMGAFTVAGRETWDAQLSRVEVLFPILRERAHQPAGLLSGGEQQMLAVARALMSSPRCLLLDEPSLGLSPKAFGTIIEAIRRINGEGIPVLIAEQNVRRILRLADYVYVLETGRIELEGEGRTTDGRRSDTRVLSGNGVTMKIIDMHSHWGTKRGYVLQTPEELAQQRATWHSDPDYKTEDEMAAYFRANNVRVILDLGFSKFLPLDEMQSLHDYSFATERAHRDVILGHWFHIDPGMGSAGVKELRRCIDNRVGFVGYAVSASKSPPGSDPSYAPFYKLCIEAGIPILFFVGTTGLGAGLPGGGGVILDNCHPRHLDLVAVHYPELKIMAARPGWPWQTETLAVLMHKRNIWYELHGWSPKYHAADLKHDIPRRLKDRVMFGGDYPLFGYERLVKDWIGEGYTPEMLEKLFHRNAEAFAQTLGLSWT